jgi:ankyrin repeat protein
LLLMAGFDPDMRGLDGCTALHIAAQFFQLDAAKLLLDSGACVLVRNGANKVGSGNTN